MDEGRQGRQGRVCFHEDQAELTPEVETPVSVMPVVEPCSGHGSPRALAGAPCPLPGVLVRPAETTSLRTHFRFLCVVFSNGTSPATPGPDEGDAGCVQGTPIQLGVLGC